jgi:thymidylate kinase
MERVRALATAVDRARLRARAGKAWREVEPLLGAPETYAEGGPGAAAAAGRLRAALRRNPANLARELYVRFLLDRVRRPRGTMVAFLGVDGAGKTTTVGLLAAKLEAARVPFAKAYFGPWGQFQTRLLAWAYRKGLTPPEEDWLARLRTGPGRLRALAKWLKGSVRALAYYAALSWDLLQRYRKDARPQLKRGGLVLVDRYPYDARHLYDGRPVTALPLARRLLCALFPKPHLLFFLFDDPEAIVARKPQLTVEQARAQQEVYRRTLAGRGAIEVRTNRPAAEIAEELATRILARYHERR